MPSADLVQALASGGPIDPALLAGLAAGEPIAAQTATTTTTTWAPPTNALIQAPTSEELERLAAPDPRGEARSTALAELCRGLADAARGHAPDSYTAWRAAAAGTDVADFRVRDALLARWAPSRVRFLPFEQPLTPIARRGALVAPAADALSTIASLIGAGAARGEPVLGAALAVTAPSRPFLLVGLTERPSDPARAARTLSLAIALLALSSTLARSADGRPEALRDLHQDALGSAPSEPLARWWSWERSLGRAPGEADALYRWSPAFTDLLARGAALAHRLRETFDEDWFRNPRVTLDGVHELTPTEDPAPGELTLARWLRTLVEL
ncbi:hypothetical protein L6R52_38330 [Myxococcota bacterium]|nr:hypothetical protein [Myxococcota bacterium]